MQTLHFDIEIQAPRAVVWQSMLSQEGYRFWTAAFCEGSCYEGGWAEGDTIRFLTPSGEGMVSRIDTARLHHEVVIRHLGMVAGGVDDTHSAQAQQWAGALEIYRFSDLPDGCRLEVAVDTDEAYLDFMRSAYPQALARLKQHAEAAGRSTASA